MSPIGQRVTNFMILVPVALGVRLAFCGAFGVSIWAARWDSSTGTTLLQLFSSPTGISAEIERIFKLTPAGGSIQADAERALLLPGATALLPPGAARSAAEIDAMFPRVFSRVGYGVAEQLVFPASSWLGLPPSLSRYLPTSLPTSWESHIYLIPAHTHTITHTRARVHDAQAWCWFLR